ncbi:hypothetical protein [Bifidobacterium colobi]|nr:hypothetical protein [Bifidobacterium colobi]
MNYSYKGSFDDQLLMSYSWGSHFHEDNTLSLAKAQGYGYWLLITWALGLSADMAYFLVWVAAAVAVGVAFWVLFYNRWLACFSYAYVLWHPIAFDGWLGTRLYRNSLFPPLMFLLLGLMLIWLNYGIPLLRVKSVNGEGWPSSGKALVGYAILGLLLGAPLCLIYLLKEDSVWCVPLLVAIVAVKIAMVVLSRTAIIKKILCAVLALCPLIPVVIGVKACEAINQRYFGVSMINTRMEGEVGDFVAKVYQVDNKDQNMTIWTPESSIDAVFNVSPTLSKNPKLLWSVKHIMFTYPDIKKNPLTGDFLTWQIRFAYDNTFGWDNERSVQDFFKQVNKEIDAAFDDGRLKKTTKISLSSMLVPRNINEIMSLIGSANYSWSDSAVIYYYRLSGKGNSSDKDDNNIRGLKRMRVDPGDPNPEPFPWFSFEASRRVSSVDRVIYSVLNVLMIIAAIVETIRLIAGLIRKIRMQGLLIYIGALGLLAYAWVYCFSVNWYTEYLHDRFVTFFYSGGVAIPLIAVPLMLFVGLLSIRWVNATSYSKGNVREGLIISQ